MISSTKRGSFEEAAAGDESRTAAEEEAGEAPPAAEVEDGEAPPVAYNK